MIVCVSQAIVGGEPAGEFAGELGRKGDESGVVGLFYVLTHHPGTGMSKRRINAYGDFGRPKPFADTTIELGDRKIVSAGDKFSENAVTDEQLVLH